MKKDILNRSKFVYTIIDFVKSLSASKTNCCFAIDGKWGSGKTFVLEMIEDYLRKYISPENMENQFFVFHYNCWQYDYYDEPSVAIVSAMLNNIEKEQSFFGETVDGALKSCYELAKKEIKKMAGDFTENSIGINVVKVIEDIKGVSKEREEENNKFDELFNFKKTLDKSRETLRNISEKKTIILVVDELDRCIPTYAIKVLERLHHLFEEINNVIIIIAVDSEQLSHSVNKIYGSKTNTKEYLKKFIDVTFKLDAGTITKEVFEIYDNYINQFTGWTEENQEIIEEFYFKIWENIDIRTQEKIINKAQKIHSLLAKESLDISLFLFEIFIIRFQNVNKSNMSWILKINRMTAGGINVEDRLLAYFRDLQQRTISYTRSSSSISMDMMVVYPTVIGKLFWLLDNVYNNGKLYILQDNTVLRNELEIAKMYRSLIDITE